MDDFSSIMNLPHHVSKKRRQMTLEERAAQFSAFAALSGYDEEIDEKGEKRVVLRVVALRLQNLLAHTDFDVETLKNLNDFAAVFQ